MPDREPDCLFCKIVAGEIPAKLVYEDADLLIIDKAAGLDHRERLPHFGRDLVGALGVAELLADRAPALGPPPVGVGHQEVGTVAVDRVEARRRFPARH